MCIRDRSCAIHMVGGVSALIGAWILGPRIGKFTKDENGKIRKVNAIPGHNLALGCLGCFILWFGWYGSVSYTHLVDLEWLKQRY